MTKSELIHAITKNQNLSTTDVTLAVDRLLEYIAEGLSENRRIEARGFGHFGLRHRKPCIKRNPKTSQAATIEAHYVPYFKASKILQRDLNTADE